MWTARWRSLVALSSENLFLIILLEIFDRFPFFCNNRYIKFLRGDCKIPNVKRDMNEKKNRKRRHDSESDSTNSEGEPKSRKIARKSSKTQLNEKKREKKKSKHEQPNKSDSGSTSGSDISDSSDHKRKRKKGKDTNRKNKQRRKKEKRKKKREKKEKRRKRRKESEKEKTDVRRVGKDTTLANIDGTRGIVDMKWNIWTQHKRENTNSSDEFLNTKRQLLKKNSRSYGQKLFSWFKFKLIRSY